MIRRSPLIPALRSSIRGFPHNASDYVRESTRYYVKHPHVFGLEVLCGAILSVVQVPESVAFSFLAHVDPVVGLHSTFLMGIIANMLGGMPALISGIAGAMVVLQRPLMDKNGLLSFLSYDDRFAHLLVSVLLCGVLQWIAALMHIPLLLPLVPATAVIGFCNGLAVIILLGQMDSFQQCTTENVRYFFDCDEKSRRFMGVGETSLWITLGYACLTMLCILILPKLHKYGKLVPGSLIGMVLCSILEFTLFRAALGISSRTIGDTANLKGSAPAFHFPTATNATSASVGAVMQVSFYTAVVGLLESLLTYEVMSKRSHRVATVVKASKECFAQGAGNVVSSLFGAIGGCCMMPESSMNRDNGAKFRLSGFAAAWFMFAIFMVASPAISVVPIGSLTGVIFVIVLRTFEWRTFVLFFKIPVMDSLAIVLVTVVSVFSNLAIGVGCGCALAAFVFAYEKSRDFKVHRLLPPPRPADTTEPEDESQDQERLIVHGDLFYGSSRKFASKVLRSAVKPGISEMNLDMQHSSVLDYSGLTGIFDVDASAPSQTRLQLDSLDEQSRMLISKLQSRFSSRLVIADRLKISANEEEVMPGGNEAEGIELGEVQLAHGASATDADCDYDHVTDVIDADSGPGSGHTASIAAGDLHFSDSRTQLAPDDVSSSLPC